jgi:hypothetical protein
MDTKTAKRVDSIYRNLKQLPLLGLLGIIPLIGILLPIVTPAYALLRSHLVHEYRAGLIVLEEHDRVSTKPGELSTEQKLLFIVDGRLRLWVPYTVGVFWLLAIAALILNASKR